MLNKKIAAYFIAGILAVLPSTSYSSSLGNDPYSKLKRIQSNTQNKTSWLCSVSIGEWDESTETGTGPFPIDEKYKLTWSTKNPTTFRLKSIDSTNELSVDGLDPNGPFSWAVKGTRSVLFLDLDKRLPAVRITYKEFGAKEYKLFECI